MNNRAQNYKIIDGTLDVVHKIQESLYEKNKFLSWTERIRQMNEEVENYHLEKKVSRTYYREMVRDKI